MKQIILLSILLISYTASQSQKLHIRAGADYIFESSYDDSKNSSYPSFNINAEYFFAKHFSWSLGAAYLSHKYKWEFSNISIAFQSKQYIINSEFRYYVSKNQDGFFVSLATPYVMEKWTRSGYDTWFNLNAAVGCRYFFNNNLGVETSIGAGTIFIYGFSHGYTEIGADNISFFGGLKLVYRFKK
jgi:hypothetical protein